MDRMNVIIDGIEYKPVEQKVDQEREGAVKEMKSLLAIHCGSYHALYDAGYRKVGEKADIDAIKHYFFDEISAKILLDHFDITKRVVK